MSSKTLIAILAALLLCACNFSGGKDNAVPRPRAYPRVETYSDSARRSVAMAEFSLSIPQACDTQTRGTHALTVFYPLYRSQLYLTTLSLSSPEEMQSHLANRRQRISLNLSGRQMQESNFRNGNVDCSVIRSLESTTIPVQLLATDGKRLLSAAFVLNGATEPLDSVRPIVDLLEKEGIAILQSIK